MGQTKEGKFLPNLLEDTIQICLIINGDNKYTKSLLENDILNHKLLNEYELLNFMKSDIYAKLVLSRKKIDISFTDRESAILFGIPANLIEGVLVGRIYEKDMNILKKIKKKMPNCYICNLDGIVIY